MTTTRRPLDGVAAGSRTLAFYGITEPTPGKRWRGLFDATWPGYRAWYLRDGDDARPTLATARRRLARHMPELVATWEQLVELSGHDETAARMLTLWDPPQFLPGCSQAVLLGEQPTLVRNYDYRPDLCERVVYSSAFTGRRVVGTGDCLWGLLDGMNDAGLALSLTFGGEPGSREGFGIPLVVRYLLELAETLEDVQRLLTGLPVGMAYNLTALDRHADAATFFVAPGRQPVRSDSPVATNHRVEARTVPQGYDRFHSVERRDTLLRLLEERPETSALVRRFLQPPLYNTAYAEGFGTIYTAAYRPAEGFVDYVWPESTWRRDFDSPSEVHFATMGLVAPGERAGDRLGAEPGDLDDLDDLGAVAEAAVRALAESENPAAFARLLRLSQLVGESLGVSARNLAHQHSWTEVADHAGTSRQAAWSRWRS